MYRSLIAVLLVLSTLLFATAARAEVKPIFERNEGTAATPRFKFNAVPSPSKTDAANKARLSIVDGEMDSNGADVDCLNDGLLPGTEDQPDSNFFFAQRANGGRLLLDLEQPTEVLRVNTYSWHGGPRGPQVYKLYASDGSAKEFNAKPSRTTDPEKAGWKLIASVDTRPQDGNFGGQYGVSIADTAGAPLGKYRYFLFDISATETRDAFGNTFFSEIDIVDGKEHAAPTRQVAIQGEPGKYDIIIDYSQMPELKDWVETKLRPTCEQWYPILVKMLPSDGYTAPKRFTIVFLKDMRGVAATGGTRIMCAGNWFSQNLEGEAVGAVVHEMVHVVQQYGRVRGGNRNPGWLVEGLTDYIRWFKYEPASKRPRPNPARAKYTDSYRVTGAFLNYLVEKHDKDIIQKFNTAMRQGKYTPDLWKECTGKTVDELWAEYMETLKPKQQAKQ